MVARSLDRIKMTKNLLEFDQKIFTTTNLIFLIWPKFMTPTNTNFTPQKYAGVVGLDRSPSPSSQACTNGDYFASPVTSLLFKKKTSGTEVRRTPDVKSRFVGFIRFVSFNFSQIQKIRFVVVIFIRSSWFSQAINPLML